MIGCLNMTDGACLWRSNTNPYTHFIYVFDLMPLEYPINESGPYEIQKVDIEADLIKLYVDHPGMNGYTFRAFFKKESADTDELKIVLVKDMNQTNEKNNICLKIRRKGLSKTFTQFSKITISPLCQ